MKIVIYIVAVVSGAVCSCSAPSVPPAPLPAQIPAPVSVAPSVQTPKKPVKKRSVPKPPEPEVVLPLRPAQVGGR